MPQEGILIRSYFENGQNLRKKEILVNNCTYNVQVYYVKIAFYFLQKNSRLLDQKMRKNYTNDKPKIKKNPFVHFSCQLVLLFIAAIGQIKSFFFLLSFARTGTCPLWPTWPHCPTFPYISRYLLLLK